MSVNGAQARQLEAEGLCTFNLDLGEPGRSTLSDLFEHDLEGDAWLPKGHEYRSRAYQCFAVDPDLTGISFIADPPPYVQPTTVNAIAGGLQRKFRCLPENHPATTLTLRLAGTFLDLARQSGVARTDGGPLRLDAHFIRISAPGKPCPEGIHRDGLIAGSVHLVSLKNVDGGETHFSTDSGEVVKSLKLVRPLDSVVFDDRRLLHYTDDISRLDPNADGHRDVLLLGLREPAS